MKLDKQVEARSAQELLQEFNETRRGSIRGQFLTFRGAEGYDVYNPSVPFEIDGKTVIAGRVEKRENEVSQTMFFERTGEEWTLIGDAPVLPLQDPFVTFVGGELVLGGVYCDWDGPVLRRFTTHYYRGKSLNSLAYFAAGPDFMKDIRLLELSDGRVAICSRPQGGELLEKTGCLAKIGFVVVDSLEEVGPEAIVKAAYLEGQFLPSEWGGANQLFALSNGLIGIIGHKSWGEMVGDKNLLHYYCMAFALDPETLAVTPVKVIGCRDCFPAGGEKKIQTRDVTFTSGIVRREDGKALLYAGLSDCDAGCMLIDDPLLEYEQL